MASSNSKIVVSRSMLHTVPSASDTSSARLCLFIVNTVFAMQFNSPLLISQDDLLVACS